jgi:hypothetical protein
MIPKGQSKEVSDAGQNVPGVYRHKDLGVELITAPGEDGAIMADALMSPLWKDAWERVGDVPSTTELLKTRKAQELKDAAEEKGEVTDEAAPAPGTGASFTPVAA